MALINGYHLWALPPESVKEFDESIEFARLRNDLGDGYRSQTLFGSENGLRRWRLTLPTLAHSDIPVPFVTSSDEITNVSREAYLWDLYCEQMVTGRPFVYQSQRDSQYYLVEFLDESLTYRGMEVKLYSSGVTIQQVRIPGVSVFNPNVVPNITLWLDSQEFFAIPGGFQWNNQALGGESELSAIENDVLSISNGLAGKNIFRLNSAAVDGVFTGEGDYTIRECFVVMKVREATFSTYGGVLTADTGNALLVGQEGTSRFFNFGFGGDYEYRLNNVEYAESDQQAPMNNWGIVHLRHPVGVTLNNLQIGKDRDTAGRFLKADIAAVIATSQLIPINIRRQLYEYLVVRWQVGQN